MALPLRFIGTLPTACTASLWNMTPASSAICAICSTGNSVPVSLLAHITETMATSSSSSAAYSSRFRRPFLSTLSLCTV